MAEGLDVSASIEALRTAVQKAPNSAEARNELGIALGAKGYLDEALDQLRTATQLKPNYGEAHYNLGITYLKKAESNRRVDPASYYESLKGA